MVLFVVLTPALLVELLYLPEDLVQELEIQYDYVNLSGSHCVVCQQSLDIGTQLRLFLVNVTLQELT